MNFEVLWQFTKVLSVKSGGVMSSGGTIGSTSEQSTILSPQKSYFPLICEFSLQKSFLLYGMTITYNRLHTRKSVDINLPEM